jgi:hypothetical protein
MNTGFAVSEKWKADMRALDEERNRASALGDFVSNYTVYDLPGCPPCARAYTFAALGDKRALEFIEDHIDLDKVEIWAGGYRNRLVHRGSAVA